jgi:hypothetical protein
MNVYKQATRPVRSLAERKLQDEFESPGYY